MHTFRRFARFAGLGRERGANRTSNPLIPAVLLTADGCYVETSDGCILTIRARESETTIEEIPEPA